MVRKTKINWRKANEGRITMLDQYQTKFGNVLINLERPHAVIKMSGGYDSSVMLYTVANSIRKLGLQDKVQIWPMCVKKIGNHKDHPDFDKRNAVPVVQGVVDFTRAAFPDVTINDLRVEECPKWHIDDKYYRDAQDAITIKLVSELNLHPIKFTNFNGVTKNPDHSIGLDQWTVEHRHHNATYAPAYPDSATVYIMDDDNPGIQEPWRNADKRIVFAIADQLGIVENMMEMTWSCEGFVLNTNNFEHECMDCWWCLERKWGYEEYKK